MDEVDWGEWETRNGDGILLGGDEDAGARLRAPNRADSRDVWGRYIRSGLFGGRTGDVIWVSLSEDDQADDADNADAVAVITS